MRGAGSDAKQAHAFLAEVPIPPLACRDPTTLQKTGPCTQKGALAVRNQSPQRHREALCQLRLAPFSWVQPGVPAVAGVRYRHRSTGSEWVIFF